MGVERQRIAVISVGITNKIAGGVGGFADANTHIKSNVDDLVITFERLAQVDFVLKNSNGKMCFIKFVAWMVQLMRS